MRSYTSLEVSRYILGQDDVSLGIWLPMFRDNLWSRLQRCHTFPIAKRVRKNRKREKHTSLGCALKGFLVAFRKIAKSDY